MATRTIVIPTDPDLAALAALSTTTIGRSLLVAANQAALQAILGTTPGTDVQAYDSDLAALAALSTTSFGRSALSLADHAALVSWLALVAADIPTLTAAKISDFTTAAIAAVPTTSILEVQVFS